MIGDDMIKILPMNAQRFRAYMMFTRTPFITFISQELEHYSNKDESIIGVLLLDLTDGDFVYIVLARDEVNHYRAFEVDSSIERLDDARERLFLRMRWFTSQNVKKVYHNGKNKGINLFVDQIPRDAQHPFYRKLKDSESHLAAKQLLLEIERFYSDIDGNFIEQFQSINGFDARVWELYLFCFLTEDLFEINRTHDRPDFIVSKGENEIAIEAAIVARKQNSRKPIGVALHHKTKEETQEENDMPLRFSNALDQKLKKKYWTLPQVKGKPLIIAIADFQDEFSMTWSFNALLELLYGYKHSFYYESNTLIINPIKLADYTKANGTKIPSGFFSWQDSEHISAIMFSCTATLAKFNRLGKQAGFGNDNTQLFRMGVRHDHDPNASRPIPFHYVVSPESRETWEEGVSLYHNPNALIPLDKTLFPTVAHHTLDNGQIVSNIPEFHPYFSITYNLFSGKT